MNTTPLSVPELWALERTDKPGHMVVPLDTNTHEDKGALVYFSRDAAESAAEYQSRYYEVDCTPRRIVTTPIDAPHEWMIYREPSDHFDWTWSPINACADVIRFPTEEAAERYIEDRGIEGAYPWPVPKLITAN